MFAFPSPKARSPGPVRHVKPNVECVALGAAPWRSGAPVVTRHGLRVPDADDGGADLRQALPSGPPALALDATLDQLAATHGEATARLAALQLEHPWRAADAPHREAKGSGGGL